MTKETSTFLKGYFFAIHYCYNRSQSDNFQIALDNNSSYVKLKMNNGDTIAFIINAGICPIGGNVPFAHTNINDSSFRIVKNFVSAELWNWINHLDNGEGEVQLTFSELCNVIDDYGYGLSNQ